MQGGEHGQDAAVDEPAVDERDHGQVVFCVCASSMSRVRAPVTYQDARELRRFKALVHIPYAWSTLALWEFLQAELVILVPSARFFLELTSSCVAWGPWLCLALGEQRAQTFSLWFQDFQYVTSAQELEYSEWWSTDLAHVLIHFDSWEELEYLVTN